jgi:anti-sigma regulatory factor (Ser/Thr protein kinase)/putative methionine-R-sulfoxide reductase with GAF domain
MGAHDRFRLRAAPLSNLFARRDRPHEGADPVSARRFVALLWLLASALTLCFLPFAPPTARIGGPGWVASALMGVGGLAGARWLTDERHQPSFDRLLAVSYLGLAQTALLQWLAGGDAPYSVLFFLWLGSGVGVHPPRRSAVFVLAVVIAGCLPLAYGGFGAHPFVDAATNAMLLLTIGGVLLILIARVRAQRLALTDMEQHARERAEEAVQKVRGLEAVADATLAQLSFDELLAELLTRISDVMRLESAALLLRDDEREHLELRAVRGVQPIGIDARRVRIGDGLAGSVALEGRAAFLEDVRDAYEDATSARAHGPRTVLGVPLLVEGGRVIGVLQAASSDGRAFSDDDVRLLQLAADRIAVAIDRARLNDQAHRIAETLQRSLLPGRIPETPGLEIATRYQPGAAGAEVGGDLYDVITYTDGRVGLAIGDVVGRGVVAASLMGQLRNALPAYALEDDRPERVVERLNRLVNHWEQGRIATFLYLVYDPKAGSARFASAGHLPPLVRAPDGSACFLDSADSVPLGVLPFGAYNEHVAQVEPASTLVLYTDGLVEERGVSLDTGLERLRCVAARGPADAEALCDTLLAEVPPHGAVGDDIAVLGMRIMPIDQRQLELRLPATPESLALMRRSLERWLAAVGADPATVFDVTVAAGEACTNAIEHAYPPGDPVLMLLGRHESGEVELTVRDFGYWRKPRRSERGRGVELMRRLMDSAQVTPGPDGTAVVLRRKLRVEASA